MKKFLAINAVALPLIAALIVGWAYSEGFFARGRFFELFGDFRQCALAFRLPTPCEAFFRALDLSALAMLAVQPRSKRYFCMVLAALAAWIACFFSGEFFILYVFRAVLYSAPALLFMKGAPFEKSVKAFSFAFALCFALGAAFNFEPAKYVRDFARAQLFPRGSDEVAEGLKDQVLANFAFSAANIFPEKVAILADKSARRLNLVGYGDSGPYLIYSYKFTGFSGKPGPKLREFDRQMPEGVYEIESYNPNSKFHLSMRLNYPNGFDKKMAKSDGRDLGKLGGDIMIHGRSGTVGCFPVGDIAIEEIFTICRLAPAQKVKVIVVPHPPDAKARAGAGKPATPESAGVPAWYPRLLDEIAAELERENLSRFLEVPEDGGCLKKALEIAAMPAFTLAVLSALSAASSAAYFLLRALKAAFRRAA